MEKHIMKTKIKQWLQLFLFLLIAALVTIIGVFINYNSTDKAPRKSGHLTTNDDYFFYATGAAVAIVSEELNYPLNSEFEPQADMSVYYNLNDDTYTINGYVNASNAFGVKKKRYFTVTTQLSVSKDRYSYYNYTCSI